LKDNADITIFCVNLSEVSVKITRLYTRCSHSLGPAK